LSLKSDNTPTILFPTIAMKSQFIITLCLLLSSINAFAEQWYHVELIVFEQLDTVTDEQWPQMERVSNTEISTATMLSPKMATPLIQAAKNETLSEAASHLNQSTHYQVHYHKAWQQPIMQKGQEEAVSIHSDNEIIEGNIRLYKATYLHAKLDLWLKQNMMHVSSWSDASPDGIDISELPRNPNLKESRRIRSKKVHYFDHPKMGALLKLTPIETPVAVEIDKELLETFSLPTEATPTVSE